MSKPLMMRPTMRPRSASGARWAAMGSSSCGTAEQMPISTLAVASTAKLGAHAASARQPAAPSSMMSIRRLRSSMSPSGTTKSIPVV